MSVNETAEQFGERFHETHAEEASDAAGTEPRRRVTFMSPVELRASVPPEPPWIVNGLLAAGALAVVAGKPKAGKSTWALAASDAIATGASAFVGREVDAGPVVYISEEGAATLAHKAGSGDIRFATRDTAWPRPEWPILIADSVAEAQRVKAKLLVIDTFAAWAGLGPESEKDAGAIQRAMESLTAATRTGLGVLLVVHTRKGGGEDGEAIRGSSALAGAADIILELERVQGGMPRQRKLLSLSRYPQTPGVIVMEHDAATGAWSVIGEGADRGDAREITDRAGLLAALDREEALTRAELEEAMSSVERQWHGTLEHLIATGVVHKSGAGRKGDPYRYKKLRQEAAQTAAQNSAATPDAVILLSAAPRRGAERESTAAPSLDSARCAESNGASAVELDDAEQERLTAKLEGQA